MARTADSRLKRLNDELDELSGRNAKRPPSIAEALAAASTLVRHRSAPPVAAVRRKPALAGIGAAALAGIVAGSWFATRRHAASRGAV